MDAVEYLKERDRMCESEPFIYYNNRPYDAYILCDVLERDDPEKAVSVVEQWSREHPVMTNAMKFKEVFGNNPDSMKKGERICPPLAFRISKDCSCKCSECDQWWDQPYKEPEGKE